MLSLLTELIPKSLLLWLLPLSEMHSQLLLLLDWQQVCKELSIESSVSCIKISCSSTAISTDLWRAACKKQCLLSQDYLIFQLLLQQICEEMSLKSSISCLKITLFFSCFWNRSVKSCSVWSCVLNILVLLYILDCPSFLACHGYPSSSVCLEYLSAPVCPGNPISPVYKHSSCSKSPVALFIEPAWEYILFCSFTAWFEVGLVCPGHPSSPVCHACPNCF